MTNPQQYQPGEVLPGTVYRVVRHLATGGMGSVYDVEDVTVEKRYVLKTLHPNLVTREDLALRMRNEAKSLAKLQHPNIVDVVTAGVTSDELKMPFYVMERLVGQNLRTVLEKSSVLPVVHAYRIAIDVADALEHAHENSIVHRDVKPENIFLHRNPNGTTTTKLLDFGIVRLLDRKQSQTHGKFIGTLRYAAPEQIMGKTIGPATDIYSLGAVLYEMLVGRGPFDDAGDAYKIGAAHASMPAPLPSRFGPVESAAERLVMAALSKEPSERPRDCFTFANELRRILTQEEASPKSKTMMNLVAPTPPTQVPETGPTHAGMVAPSAVMSGTPQAAAQVPSTRPEGRGRVEEAVNPVGPTLAAGIALDVNAAAKDFAPTMLATPDPLAPEPRVEDAALQPTLASAGIAPAFADPSQRPPATPPLAGNPYGPAGARGIPFTHPPAVIVAPPPPSFGPPPAYAGAPGIDRNAPTRESAPLAPLRRAPTNDTQVEPSVSPGAIKGSTKGETVAIKKGSTKGETLVVPPVGGTGSHPSDIVFPPMQSATPTGPMAGEVGPRPPERGALLVAGVALGAVVLLGGGALAVTRPWRSGADGPVATAPAASAATPTPAPAPTPTPSPTPTPTASLAETPVATASASASASASSPAPAKPTHRSAETRPRPASPTTSTTPPTHQAPNVKFDP